MKASALKFPSVLKKGVVHVIAYLGIGFSAYTFSVFYHDGLV